MNGKLNKLLHDLVYQPTPSGHEKLGLEVLTKWVHEQTKCDPIYQDHIGNTIFSIGNGSKSILLTGHIDEIHGRITKIYDNGILSFKSTGGIDKKAIIGTMMAVMVGDTLVPAACIKKAIHCEKKDEDKVGEWSSLRLDVGATSAEEVQSMGIRVGSYVVHARNFLSPFGQNRVCANALDDKIGVVIAMGILDRLNRTPKDSTWRKHYKILAGCTTQEETGLRGAHIAAHNLNPNISIDFDVTHATDAHLGVSEDEYCDISLGKGPVIEYGCDKSESLNEILQNTAIFTSIPTQSGVNRAGGTDTTKFELEAEDCETTLISIPQRSMHTPCEVCDWNDVLWTIELVTTAIINCEF